MEGSEWERANCFDKFTFRVVNDLIRRGIQKALQYDDIMKLPSSNRSSLMVDQLDEQYRRSQPFWIVPKLITALIWCHLPVVILVNILGFMEGVVRIASPVVLGFLLKAMQSSSRTKEAFVYAGILAALNLAQTVIHHILFFYSMDMGWKAKTATIGLIFRQLFRITASFQSSNSELSSSGRLVNLISNDVARFELFATFSFFAYISLFELAAILIILCFYLNVAAGFAGVFMTIACIPAQVYFASLIAQFRRAIGACTDQRVRFISEVIEGISTVKCYGWEIPFYSLIGKFRQKEMKFIDRSLDVKSVNLALYYFSPPLACFATFSVFWGTGGTLTFPLVFSTISLLLQLRTSIGRQWTIAMESSSEAFASCARVEAFLDVFLETGADANGGRLLENSAKVETTTKKADFANNSQIELTSLEQKPMSPDIVAIRTSAYSYSNGAGDSSVVLKDVSLSVQAGELLMIVGAVGSGKSTLLNVILGELKAVGDPEGNSRWMKPGIRLAYCAQKPWILAASVKSNIVLAGAASAEDEEDAINVPNSLKICSLKFPREINSKLYKRALSCCRINEDINLWASGDETEIGERGISISGGQKARLGLARAVYADADLYVLDDVLSAVDAHVGKALFEDCILGALRDRNKAVILATHQVQYLPFADKVVVVSPGGKQLFFGTYSDLCKSDCVIPGVAASSAPVDAVSDRVGGKARAMSDTSACSDSSCADPAAPEAESGKSSKKAFEGVQAEDRVEGSLSWAVISKYIHSGGTILGSSALFIAVCSQVLLMMTDYWLKWWASGFFWKQDSHNNLGIYGGLVGLCIIFGFLRSFAWFRFSQNAAQSLHERALWAIFHAPMHFFVSNPSGRILNRFSRDQNQVDELLPYTMFDCLQSLLFSIASVILVCVTIPWLIILVVPMIYAFYWLRNQYIQSSRELKRLEATLRSPIYADFSATLDGLVTLRAYQLEGKVTKSFQRHLDRNTRAFFSFLMVSRWLGFRLDLESALLVTAVALLSVGLRDQVDVGLLGLALTYTMALSGLLQWATRQSGETENMLTSVERLSSYALLEPEPGYHVTLSMYQDSRNIENHSSSVAKRSSANKAYEAVAHGVEDPPSSNAVQGLAVQLRDCFVKYRDDLDPVLRNFSVDFPAGAKVGICGRTGSGKSSTLLALLRLNIVSSGSIIVGDKSLLDMDLEAARGCISVIPQEPHLFSGTIRFNLDPFSNYSDAELWDALEDACIKDTIAKDPKGLDGVVEDNGKNFSVGQRQLLSMARAILRKCPVILMDEVTASIDYETDRLIQQTIRTSSALRSCTIITVAHRLRTIADSDLIVVVNGGEIAEVGSPQVLLRTEDSLFKGLALQSNEMDEIVRIANSKSS